MAVSRARAHDHTADADDDMDWLAQAAPQFHTEPDALPDIYLPRAPSRDKDDHETGSDSEDGSGSDSDGSDSSDDDGDEDPAHPYNVPDNAHGWHNDGRVAYYGGDLQDSFLSGTAGPSSAADDAPYVPPADNTTTHMSALYRSIVPAPDDVYAYDASLDSAQRELSPVDLPMTNTLPANGEGAIPGLYDLGKSSRTPARRRPFAVRRGRYGEVEADSDEDAEGSDVYEESSADDASEDEYRPSPKSSARKSGPYARRRVRNANRKSYSPYPSSPASSASSRLSAHTAGSRGSSAASTGSGSGSANSARRAGSRNVQLTHLPPPPRGAWAKTGPLAYRCPHCEHVQANKRAPDLERHIRSHWRDERWVCAGVPAGDAAAADVVEGNENPWVFEGRALVGGCHKTFSRMDALKRHWKNGKTCVGDIRYACRKVHAEEEQED